MRGHEGDRRRGNEDGGSDGALVVCQRDVLGSCWKFEDAVTSIGMRYDDVDANERGKRD